MQEDSYTKLISTEHRIIVDMVTPSASVLDLGCGTGDLLASLVREKGVKAQGIEIDDQSVYQCVGKGLSVFHDDIDTGLPEYGGKSFDYVILNQCFQQVRKPDVVLREALRVGKEVIIGIPNFAHINARTQIFFKGRTPVTPALPYEWHNTPNLHFLSILDFVEYCKKRGITIEEAHFVGTRGRVTLLPNLFAQTGIFLVLNGHGCAHGSFLT
jgi:methionine biosynthesis protein MetW